MNSVTVIIPNYNGEAFLADCLDSLRRQTYKDFCIIVVDNCSSDKSLEILERDYPEASVIALSENTGFANAVNVGIRAAESKYVFLLNNDTVCDENAIDALVKLMDKKPLVFSAQSKMLQQKNHDLIDDAGDYYCALGWAFSPARDKKSVSYNKRIAVTSACAGAAMYRREVFEKIGFFDEAHFCYLEDVDLGYRARLFGYMNVMEPDSIVYHVGSGSSGSRHNTFKVELTAANNLYLIYKNMPILQIILNLPLIILGILIKHVFYTRKGLGKAHIRGLSQGFSKISDNSNKKVRFSMAKLPRYIGIQLELWINCLVRLGLL